MSDIEIQSAVYSIIIVTLFMALLLVYINRKLVKFDPLSKPTGIVLLVIMYAQMIDGMVKSKTNEKVALTS